MVLLSVTILPSAVSLPKNIFLKMRKNIFVHDDVEIVDGCRVLGSVIDSDNAEKKFVERSLKQQKSLLKTLVVHANFSPQNVFKSFTSSVQQKLILAHTSPNFEDLLKECEKSIKDELLPILLKNPTNQIPDFSVPITEGGLNIHKLEDRFKECERSVQQSGPYLCAKPN